MPLPFLNENRQQRVTTQEFKGLNRGTKAGDGEFYDETNMSSRDYPCASPRTPRGVVAAIASPYAIGGDHTALAYCAGTKLYYNGVDTGIALSTAAGMTDKRIVSFGAYLLVFPDKQYYNTADSTDKGAIEDTFSMPGTISYAMCTDDGTDYDTVSIPKTLTAPANPAHGAYWIDVSAPVHKLMQYSSYTAAWVHIPTTYIKISYSYMGSHFREYDAVTLTGLTVASATYGALVKAQIEALNGSKVVYGAGQNYIIVAGLLDEVCSQPTAGATVTRTMPTMDHVIACGNRLWGCRSGLAADGVTTVNEIYASRLGDFRNFYNFMGTSLDSWVASIGQGGAFTGAANYMGIPVFFKEAAAYKVLGSNPSNFQVSDTICAGVKAGSSKSVCNVGSSLLYLSRDGEVVAYDGALPYSLFGAFGSARYADGIAGTLDGKYYISVKDNLNAYHLLTYDTRKNLWHREDALRPIGFQFNAGELYALTSTQMLAMTGKAGTAEAAPAWSMTTGLIGWESADRKYISRFNIRASMGASSTVKLEIEYNTSGTWEDHGTKSASSAVTGTVLLPVRPHRCDHFRLRISGTGSVMLYSIDRILEAGSDGPGA